MTQKICKVIVDIMYPDDEVTCINNELQLLGVDATNVISIVPHDGPYTTVYYRKEVK